MPAIHTEIRRLNSQQGFTLLEIMIALTIGLFLLGALVTIVQSNKAAFLNQSQLAQMQDSERMAMTLMAEVIQEAGYFPDPTTNTVGGTLIASGAFANSQAITGGYVAAAPGDTISVRYMTAPLDGILNCSGVPNPNPVGGANILYVNQFNVAVTAGVPGGQLICTVTTAAGTTAYTLVNGVTNLRVFYGVKTNVAALGNNADTYLLASQMTAAYWSSVITVMVQLTFNNPLAAQPGQPPSVTLQRVINLMNQSGPST
jgi:type IV pilus assembly protein PilW